MVSLMLGFSMGEFLLQGLDPLSVNGVGSCGCLGLFPPGHLLLRSTISHCLAVQDTGNMGHASSVLTAAVCFSHLHKARIHRFEKEEEEQEQENR